MHNRQSYRLNNYDYSRSGAYFVTICAHSMKCDFGEIIDANIQLSPIGESVHQCWLNIPKHYPDVTLDEFVIMPNHVHGIIFIYKNSVGAKNFEPLRNSEPLQNQYQNVIPRSLGSIIRGFKIDVTKWCRQNKHTCFRWQRNFHDHIIRNEQSLNQIREYIINNPLKWDLDKNNPKNFLT